jgi:hypothetical protein
VAFESDCLLATTLTPYLILLHLNESNKFVFIIVLYIAKESIYELRDTIGKKNSYEILCGVHYTILALMTGLVLLYNLILTKGGNDRSAEEAYSSIVPDPTFAFLSGSVVSYTRLCICLLDYYCV